MGLSQGRRLWVERNMDKAVRRGRAHPAGVEEHITRKRIVVGTWEVPRSARADCSWSASREHKRGGWSPPALRRAAAPWCRC
jgi:hypothetical protein